mgnify:CR=1 FL=1
MKSTKLMELAKFAENTPMLMMLKENVSLMTVLICLDSSTELAENAVNSHMLMKIKLNALVKNVKREKSFWKMELAQCALTTLIQMLKLEPVLPILATTLLNSLQLKESVMSVETMNTLIQKLASRAALQMFAKKKPKSN